MLTAQVKEKFPAAASDISNALKSPIAEQCTFGSRLLHLLFTLQVTTKLKFLFTLSLQI
jgi:hypothetical protein